MKALYILVAVAGIYLPTFAVAQVPLQTLRTCLKIEDQSKERLDCFDAKIKPAPKEASAPAKTIRDCRFLKEEDERLKCFNRFVNVPSKKTTTEKKQ
jgi:actin-related protein